MATIAELELELGKERRAASREARVARGLAATKPMKLDAAQQKRLLRLYQQGEPVSELTAMFGISRSTLFRTLKVLKQRSRYQRERVPRDDVVSASRPRVLTQHQEPLLASAAQLKSRQTFETSSPGE